MHFKFLITVFLLVAGIAMGCNALSISVSPEGIEEGDEIEIEIRGLSDDASFAALVETQIEVGWGERFVYELEDFVLPVSLRGGQIEVSTAHAAFTTLSTALDGRTVEVGGPSKDGVYTFSQQTDIPAGTYPSLTLRGEALPASSEITAQIRLNGKKTGPEDCAIAFQINGVTEGASTVEVAVDGKTVLRETIPIGGGVPAAGTSSGAAGAVWAEDRQVCLEGPGLGGVGLTRGKSGNVPEGWTPLGDAVVVIPEDRVFQRPVHLVFMLPGGEAAGTVTIFTAVFDGGTWEILPSMCRKEAVVTEIGGAGTYRLMRFAGAETTHTPTPPTTPARPAPSQSSPGPSCLIAGAILFFVLPRGRR